MLEALSAHAVTLAGYDRALQRQIIGVLEDLEGSLLEQLLAADPASLAKPTHRLARLQKMLPQIRDTIDSAYGDVEDFALAGMGKAAGAEFGFVDGMLRSLLGPVVDAVGVNTVAVTPELLRKIASETLVDFGGNAGAFPVSSWLSEQKKEVQTKFVQEVRRGLYAGESNQEIARRVAGGGKHVGIGAVEGPDGILPISRNWAKATVRTATSSVTEEVRLALYEGNQQVIKGLIQVSTTDDRTCFARGTLVSLSDGSKKAIEHIQPGDLVLSGAGRIRRVSAVIARQSTDWRNLHLASGEVVRCTSTHPFWTKNGWTEARDLAACDAIGVHVPAMSENILPSAPPMASSDLLFSCLPGALEQRKRGAQRVFVQKLRHHIQAARKSGEALLLTRVHVSVQGTSGVYLHGLWQDVSGSSTPARPPVERRLRPNLLQCCLFQEGPASLAASRKGLHHLWKSIHDEPKEGRMGSLLEEMPTPEGHVGLPNVRQRIRSGSESKRRESTLQFTLLSQKQSRNQDRGDAQEDSRAVRLTVSTGGQDSPLVGGFLSLRMVGGGVGRNLLASKSGPQPQGCRDSGQRLAPAPVDGGFSKRRNERACLEGGVPSPTGWASIERIDIDGNSDFCYDLEIEHDHSFLVGDSCLIAHNTIICIAYASKRWFYKGSDIVPDGHSLPYQNGCPRHVACRSLTAPWIKSIRELRLEDEDVPAAFRKALDGEPPPVPDGNAILRGLSEEKQIKVLGRTRWEEWKKGASVDSFVEHGKVAPLAKSRELRNAIVGELSGPSKLTESDMVQKVLEKVKADPSYVERQFENSDKILEDLASWRRFDGRPKVVSAKEFAETPGEIVFRGISGRDAQEASLRAEEFRSGKYFAGKGTYGNGTYGISGKRELAESYARGGSVLEMKMLPGANVIEIKELEELQDEWLAALSDHVRRLLSPIFEDPGKFATLMGYDAIYVSRNRYTVILNRSMVSVLE